MGLETQIGKYYIAFSDIDFADVNRKSLFVRGRWVVLGRFFTDRVLPPGLENFGQIQAVIRSDDQFSGGFGNMDFVDIQPIRIEGEGALGYVKLVTADECFRCMRFGEVQFIQPGAADVGHCRLGGFRSVL